MSGLGQNDAQAPSEEGADNEQHARQSRRFGRWYFIAWAVGVIGLAIWLATGTVATTTYSYNPITELTYRLVTDEPVQDIWAHQAQNLPSVGNQTILDGAFVVSVAVVVLCVMGGSWLLLVTASEPIPSDARLKRRSSILKQCP
jgi:hypothetical protein